MKKIDWTIWLGILIGLAAIAAAAWFEDLNAAFLWNPAAALIVFGGTLGAVIVKRGTTGLKSAILSVYSLQFHNNDDEDHRVQLARLAWLARAARKKGLKTYEGIAENIDDVLLSNAFVLLAENASKERVEASLKARIELEDEQGMKDVKTLESAGGFAPTFGILGAVIGLTSVLRLVDDPSALGAGIAAAFVATIYGIASANLLLFPLASRLRDKHDEEMLRREEIASVIVALHERETPRAIINQFNLMK